MNASTIRALLSPPDSYTSNVKTLAFLDANFTSFDDLNYLEAESSKAQAQREELMAKMSASQTDLDDFLRKARELTNEKREQGQELAHEYHSLTDDLSYLTEYLFSSMSDESRGPTILEDVETLHRNLKELENIKEYVQVIRHTLTLSQRAINQIRALGPNDTVNFAVVTDFQVLRDFVRGLTECCSSVEDVSGQQQLRLLTWARAISQTTWASIKNTLSSSLLDSSEKLGWPAKIDLSTTTEASRQRFAKAFLNLIQLQVIGEELDAESVEGLYPLNALIKPISQRFKFHFEMDRETNKLDKPEWYFTHVLNVIEDHRQFMETSIQPLLSQTSFKHLDAWREFAYLLLALLARKLKKTVPLLLSYPSLLAHTVYQALAFDTALVNTGFSLAKTTGADKASESEPWLGTSEVILGRREWFTAWVDGEKKFVEDQYHQIISSPDAWTIASDDGEDDRGGRHDLPSTNSARRIKALVEQVTDRYSPLPSFSQKTTFLISVQLPALEWYHGRISSSLDAFETLSSAFLRAVPGSLGVSLGRQEEATIKVDSRRLTTGTDGLQRLCKALLSAKYIEMAMAGWGEEMFFLELWAEINKRVSLKSQAQETTVLPDPNLENGEDAPQDTIFEELITQYSKLVSRAEDMIVQQAAGEVESGLKVHLSQSHVTSGIDDSDISVSQTLLGPLALLSSFIKLLRSTLPDTTFHGVYRRIASRISEHVLHRQILYRGHIPLSEAKLISTECELWVETSRIALGPSTPANRAEAPWRNMLQAGRLIGLDEETKERVMRLMYQGEDAWEQTMIDVVGLCEMEREQVMKCLRLVNQ